MKQEENVDSTKEMPKQKEEDENEKRNKGREKRNTNEENKKVDVGVWSVEGIPKQQDVSVIDLTGTTNDESDSETPKGKTDIASHSIEGV